MKKRKIAAIATLIASGAMMTGCDDPFGFPVCLYGAPVVESDSTSSTSENTTKYNPAENILVDVYGPPEFFDQD